MSSSALLYVHISTILDFRKENVYQERVGVGCVCNIHQCTTLFLAGICHFFNISNRPGDFVLKVKHFPVPPCIDIMMDTGVRNKQWQKDYKLEDQALRQKTPWIQEGKIPFRKPHIDLKKRSIQSSEGKDSCWSLWQKKNLLSQFGGRLYHLHISFVFIPFTTAGMLQRLKI